MKLLITGGAGFIGSNFIRYILVNHRDYHVTNLDKLTYAGNLDNLRDIEGHPHYCFIKGDICDPDLVDPLAKETDVIINFAAETHVDRSIMDPGSFIRTDVYGTYVLLEAARRYNHKRYIQISTDEVYGSIESGSFTEDSPIHPNSPYSASKASSDLIVQSCFTDRRYALSCRKIASLGFKPRHALEKALSETIRWYRETPDWWRKIKSGEFQKYYEQMYAKRDLKGEYKIRPYKDATSH